MVVGKAGGVLDKQFLALVSQEVLSTDDPQSIDLKSIGQQAANLLRTDPASARRLQQLLGTWTDPRTDATKFVGQLAVDMGVEQLNINEPTLLSRLQGVKAAVEQAKSGRPDDAQLHPAHTAAAWNDSFVRLSHQYDGIEPGVDAREYTFPGGKAMVERLIDLLGIKAGDVVYNPGSGEGGEARHLARMGVRVIGRDISDVGCANAERINREEGLDHLIDILPGDINRTRLPEKVDFVLAPDCDGLHYAEDRVNTFAEILADVKPGGKWGTSLYLPNVGTPKEVCDEFDQSMAWAGLTPSGCNAETYIKQMEEAGFVDVEAINISDVYREWNQAVQDSGKGDAWLDGWIEGDKKSGVGFGFILVGRRPEE